MYRTGSCDLDQVWVKLQARHPERPACQAKFPEQFITSSQVKATCGLFRPYGQEAIPRQCGACYGNSAYLPVTARAFSMSSGSKFVAECKTDS